MSYELAGLLALLAFIVGLLAGLVWCYTRRPRARIIRTRTRRRYRIRN